MPLISLVSFSPNTLIQSSQVNANFAAIAGYINTPPGTLTQNGFVTLPGGIILAWGAFNNLPVPGPSTITFPTAFPNHCWALAFALQYNSGAPGASVVYRALSATQFSLEVDAPIGQTISGTYFAVGN